MPKTPAETEKARRLAAALRANLKRRKAAQTPENDPPTPPKPILKP